MRKSIRLKSYDYSKNGYYFITICTALRKPYLGRFGKEAEEILQSLTMRFPGLTIDYHVLMPDHLHAIFVFNDVKRSLGEVIRMYKSLVTKVSGVKPFWEWNYYEHVIRNEEALYKIRKYIQENPEKEKIDTEEIYGIKCPDESGPLQNKI
jgi:putative transposase